MSKLNVLYVEDNEEDRKQYERDLPKMFQNESVEVDIDTKSNFDEAFKAINNPHLRYDLIISDTYKGEHKNKDTAVFEIIDKYKSNGKFCPIIVYSSGECPAEFKPSKIVSWADKTNDDLQNRIREILKLGIPQLARQLHDEIDKAAGSYLWGFLENNLDKIVNETSPEINKFLERIIRKRAAIQICDLMPNNEKFVSVQSRYGLEYYIYPAFENEYYNLGDIIRHKTNNEDFRVILTPHCLLYGTNPKADYILTIQTESVNVILGEKLSNAKGDEEPNKKKKLSKWARSPAQTDKAPEGRHWYLPKFLDIPHLYCDFLKINSLEYTKVKEEYNRIATLTTPYAEALQECFSSFYGSVGIPNIETDSIKDLLK